MMAKTPKHILVIRLSAMGDVAMTVPVLRAFTQQHPEIKLTVLTRKFFAPFFEELPHVHVFPVDVNDKHKGVYGLYKLSRELKTLNIDAVADLHNVLRSKILKTFLSVKPCAQIDKGRAEKKALVSGQKFQQLKTTHQRYADVFETLGFTVDLSKPSFPETKALSKASLNITGTKANPWIGIAPFATYDSKMYPLHLMEEVIAGLSSNANYSVLLFGGASERDQLDKLQMKRNKVINLAGKLSLNEELEVISNLDVMLSMDSGNAHIAAMLGVKVITIWGVTHPYAGFYPFGQNIHNGLLADNVQYPKIPTSVYGNKYPENYKNAAASIKVEDVVKKIKSTL